MRAAGVGEGRVDEGRFGEGRAVGTLQEALYCARLA